MSPRIDPEARRAEILDAALRCFKRTGYTNTSMDDIVKESGLSKGTLYWHFKNKRDLFFALFDGILLELIATTKPRTDSTLPVAEQVRQMITVSVQGFEQNPELFKLPLNFLVELWQEEGFIAHYRDVITAYADQIEALIEEGVARGEFRAVDAHELTWAILALYDGLILYHALDMPGDFGSQFSLMIESVLDGLRKPE